MTNELPELPESPMMLWQHSETGRKTITTGNHYASDWRYWDKVSALYTAEQMQAYARAAVEQAGRGEPNLPINELLAEYEMQDWTAADCIGPAKRYVSTMPDSQVRCLLHILSEGTPTASAGVTEAWHNVSDVLPAVTGWYIGCWGGRVEPLRWSGEYWNHTRPTRDLATPTHWMRMPTPPDAALSAASPSAGVTEVMVDKAIDAWRAGELLGNPPSACIRMALEAALSAAKGE
jgi:hypothetical protein